MRVLVLGSTGRIGSIATAVAVSRGMEVVAVVRDPAAAPAGVSVIHGDIQDAAVVLEAVHGVDAVIAAVGPRSNTLEAEMAVERGMDNLVNAMRDQRVARLVALSGAGVDVPGERKPALDRIASWVVRRAAAHVVGAKQREYDVLARSGLAWTALRPPIVTDGQAAGYRLSTSLTPGARVTRADIAAALVDQLADDTFVRAAPFVLPARRGAAG